MVESDTMEYRYVGNSGLKVSVLGFGFGNVTSDISADSEQWSYECIDKCIRAGINFLDTAELYGMGESEEILGSTLKQGGWDREELVITTKFHPRCFGIQGLARKRCRQALDNSLKRLQLDYVDIVYLHRFDPSTPLEESIRLMNKLIDDEKTFYWGTCEFTPQQLVEVHKICDDHGWVHPIVEQCQYNMFERKFIEREYVPIYKEYGIGTTTYSAVCSGLLSGKYNDGTIPAGRGDSGQFSGHFQKLYHKYIGCRKEEALKILNGLNGIADELGCSQSQLAIAWVIKNTDVACALFAASNSSQLDESLKSVDLTKKLTPEVLERIEILLRNRPSPLMNWRNFAPLAPRR